MAALEHPRNTEGADTAEHSGGQRSTAEYASSRGLVGCPSRDPASKAACPELFVSRRQRPVLRFERAQRRLELGGARGARVERGLQSRLQGESAEKVPRQRLLPAREERRASARPACRPPRRMPSPTAPQAPPAQPPPPPQPPPPAAPRPPPPPPARPSAARAPAGRGQVEVGTGGGGGRWGEGRACAEITACAHKRP